MERRVINLDELRKLDVTDELVRFSEYVHHRYNNTHVIKPSFVYQPIKGLYKYEKVKTNDECYIDSDRLTYYPELPKNYFELEKENQERVLECVIHRMYNKLIPVPTFWQKVKDIWYNWFNVIPMSKFSGINEVNSDLPLHDFHRWDDQIDTLKVK